jgi:hypothetical protein
VDMTFRHSLYQREGGEDVERFVWEDFTWSDPKILRLIQSSLSVGLRLSSSGKQPTAAITDFGGILWQEPETPIPPSDTVAMAPTTAPVLPRAWNLLNAPWDLTLSGYYSVNHTTDIRTMWLNAAAELELTPKWRLGYNTRLDLDDGSIVSAGLTVYRDLHCWEGRFIWNPVGLGKGYYLRISVKSRQLQDLKLERRRGEGSFLGI